MCEISIIVPVYNVEKYLRKCVESILNQTFKDFELILVDDGSPDNSGAICDQYAKRDARVRVIHKENGGLSSARNAGIEIAKGKYLGFVDSDDYIAEDMYEVLFNQIIAYNANISTIEMIDVYENRVTKVSNKKKVQLINQKDAIKAVLDSTDIFAYAVNKLYQKELFDKVRYPEGKIVEDAFIIMDLLLQCDRVVSNTEQKYFYYRRNDSITGLAFSEKNFDVIEAWEYNGKLINKVYPELLDSIQRRICWSYFDVLDKMALSDEKGMKESRKQIVNFLRSNFTFVMKNSVFTKSRKLSMIALMISNSCYDLLAKIKYNHVVKKNS
ncbi:glycosyltransferase family 2 protein [Enterococcus sp.]|uniref:glycosyltransferase family 2 protein n=1 Tax=Enterococcus sp. TaxID=35783 RepID=UPI0029072147|nr:glycosyltransferase family 2 protein [Enterococcus sp.]MDU5335237.1 glycosyltransferase family 2 protein [Enterococcus sp.]